MRILITGHAGFIGSKLAKRLLLMDHEVFGIDNFSTGKQERIDFGPKLKNKLTTIQCDLKDYDTTEKYIRKIQPAIVFHLAAKTSVPDSFINPREYWLNNVDATYNLLVAISHLDRSPKFIFASSSSVYGSQAKHNVTESDSQGASQLSPYALTKMICENTIRMESRLKNFPFIILRYFNVYSNTSEGRGVVDKWISAREKGESIYQYGNTLRDYTHVEDIVTANILAMTYIYSDTFNIGSGRGISLSSLATYLKVTPIQRNSRFGDITCCTADIAKARRELNYVPIFSAF